MISIVHKNDPPNWQAIRFTVPVIVKAVSVALLLVAIADAKPVKHYRATHRNNDPFGRSHLDEHYTRRFYK